jgi:ureidoglycolate hydrolase
MDKDVLEIMTYDGRGYKPLVDFGSWRVAMLHNGGKNELESIEKMERHTETDEVFVLLKGKGVLVMGVNQPQVGAIELKSMAFEQFYNVRQSSWHTVWLSQDASVLLVENRDTGELNTEFSHLTRQQVEMILEKVRLGQIK